MQATNNALPTHVEVVVIGAGLSGIGAGYRVQTECPDRDYLILEARSRMGGTWDLFQYPGIRSDSDMFTLGYAFKPWRDAKSIADGSSILRYIRDTASEFGIDDHIRYGTRVIGADWSSASHMWTLTVDRQGTRTSTTCDFLYVCAGYYDYDNAYAPSFPGTEDFAGRIVHPQFWPDDLDYAGKQIVVIGSGATAVTLVPSMASATTHVTMLQRSPTWISAVPSRDAKADWLRAHLPERLAHRMIRAKNVAFNIAFYQFCQRLPERARTLLLDQTTRILGDDALVVKHFTPSYKPWDQRLCAAPSADFFKSINAGHADVVTDTIDTFVAEGVRLSSGRVLPADLVVTATGLQLQTFGGITPTIDGNRIDVADEFVWNGAMVSGIPNFAFCIGYTNASWTLRADLSSRLVCKVLNWMRAKQYQAVVPRPAKRMTPRPLFGLTSGYVQRSVADFPKQGRESPWHVRQNYLLDAVSTLRSTFDATLLPVPSPACARPGDPPSPDGQRLPTPSPNDRYRSSSTETPTPRRYPMPMIELTLRAGVLDDTTRCDLQKTLAATLLKWEGAPDTAFFRAQAWSRIDEVPGDRFAALEDERPRFRVDVTVPEGALSHRRREGLVKEVSEQVLAAAGLAATDALRVWVLVHEQPEGTWGAGGAIVRFQDLKAAAQSSRAQI